MKDFVSRHPIVFSLIVVAIYDPDLTTLFKVLAGANRLKLPFLLTAQAALCAYVVVLLTRLGWWRDAGFAKSITWRRVFAYLPWLLLPLLTVMDAGIQTANAGRVIGFTFFALMIGFAEEGLLRGVVLRALLPTGAMRAALLSSIVFGIAHLSNILHGQDPGATIVQAIYATFVGIGFAGPRLFTGTILPAIVFHALIDFSDIAGRGFVLPVQTKPITPLQAVVPIAVTALYALYGWWLLRRYVKESQPAARRNA